MCGEEDKAGSKEEGRRVVGGGEEMVGIVASADGDPGLSRVGDEEEGVADESGDVEGYVCYRKKKL